MQRACFIDIRHQNGACVQRVFRKKKNPYGAKVMCVVTAMPYTNRTLLALGHTVRPFLQRSAAHLLICLCACARFTSSRIFYSLFLLLVYLLLLSHLYTIFLQTFLSHSSHLLHRFDSFFLFSFARLFQFTCTNYFYVN